MRWSDIPFHPPERMLRQFAGLWLLFFGLLAVWQGLWRQNAFWGVVLAALALGIGTAGLVRPAAVRPIFVGWIVLAFPIGWAVSHLLLALVYFGLFTPLALAFRLAGRDVLSLRKPEVSTYWKPKPMADDPRSYFRQF